MFCTVFPKSIIELLLCYIERKVLNLPIKSATDVIEWKIQKSCPIIEIKKERKFNIEAKIYKRFCGRKT